MTSIVNRRDGFISDIMKMITSGTSNDVKIVVEDGEILANKDVLSARSDYFATMFSNNSNKEIKIVEGETKGVPGTLAAPVPKEALYLPGAAEWPPSLKAYVQKCFSLCITDLDKAIMEMVLKVKITAATKSNSLWTKNWDEELLQTNLSSQGMVVRSNSSVTFDYCSKAIMEKIINTCSVGT